MVKKKTEIQWGKMNKNILKTKRKPQKIILKSIYQKRHKIMKTDCNFYLLYFTMNKVVSSQRNTYKTHVFLTALFFYVFLKDLKNTILKLYCNEF